MAAEPLDGSARCRARIGSRRSNFTVDARSSDNFVSPSESRSAATPSKPLTSSATDARLAARSFADGGILERRARRCHLVQLVQEAVDRRGLLRRIGDEVAHQVTCTMHGLSAEALPKLTNQLLAQQLNLLPTLGFDAFQLGVCMGSQLLGDLLGVVPGLVDHLRRLGLGLFQRLGMLLVGVGDLLLGLGMVAELSADSLLLVLHHGADRRHDVFPEQKDDDGEADELSDEGRHSN